ncbi:MAG: hypothetical protein ETSY2_49325 [Candidatus Entotheonella gemina]|uniref:Uncharacterized protein n=1 Tax=Candidatus Entotheonella gemina TaxID=1429439 RepID=W4L9Y0_9BACT|nr:MAG: hypothetical protein ETSY2_49325 [Candidatus Entotheonella gemina]
MAILITLNGAETAKGILIAPFGGSTFPAKLGLRSDDGKTYSVDIEASDGGADIELEQTTVEVGEEEVFVNLHATAASMARDDTILRILNEGSIEAALPITAVENPRIFFDGRFETRFSTGAGFYNAPRGGTGWMWVLEDEPDFVPAGDVVPDRIDKKPVGRQVRFHNAAIDRPHVSPIGVTVQSVIATVNGVSEPFTEGDPVIGMSVQLGADTYFASNQPIDPDDRAAGRLPEERHQDGEQPLANFEFILGDDAFSGGSQTGPFVPGTTESSSPRDPDFRPYANGLEPLNAAEGTAYPFPTLQGFAEARVNVLLPDYVELKEAGQADTVAFRNLQTRIGHLLPDVPAALRDQILADHAADGMQVLGRNPPFTWGNKEVYRGMINDQVMIDTSQSPVLDYFSRFESFHFLSVFFNFHTDECRGGIYGSVDPLSEPPLIR